MSFYLMYKNHHCWQLDSCTFDPQILFKRGKIWSYLCETGGKSYPYGIEGF